MADDVDKTNDQMETIMAAKLKSIHAGMVKGYPGECDLCGEHSERLVGDACAPCRDRHGLP